MIRKRYLIASAYIVALHVAALVLADKVQAVPKIVAKIGMARVLGDFGDRMQARPPSRPIVFLGDSITAGIGMVPTAVNLGGTGDTTTDLLATIDGKPMKLASGIALMIGLNDIWRGKTAGLDERLAAVARAMPPKVPLIWSSITPADDFRIDPADIVRANATIKALCAAHPRCTFVDTWKLLADDAGKPIPAYFALDGVHLGPQGYERWLAAVESRLPLPKEIL